MQRRRAKEVRRSSFVPQARDFYLRRGYDVTRRRDW
jgi:hypothetical protein